jgi:hypothetical protein
MRSKNLLLSVLDLVQTPRFLREVVLGEEISKLLTELLEQDAIQPVDPERVGRVGRCERCLNVRMRESLITVREREVLAV